MALRRQRRRGQYCIGSGTYKLLRNLLSPDKPGEKAYADIVAALAAHFSPPPSQIVQQYKFNSHFRNPGKSVATFVAELHLLAEHCNYGQTLEVMLHDYIVCGMRDDAIQGRLLSEKELTFKKALEIAQTLQHVT